LSRLLKACRIETLDEVRARSAGLAYTAVGSSNNVDASVLVGAAARAYVAVTSDTVDIDELLVALNHLGKYQVL